MGIEDDVNYPETGDYHQEREIKRAKFGGHEDQAFVENTMRLCSSRARAWTCARLHSGY